MRTNVIVALLSAVSVLPVSAQGMLESNSIRGLSAGVGGGTAAILNDNAPARAKTPMLTSAQQTKIYQTNMAKGNAYQAKKQLSLAKAEFESALKIIAARDGIGSPNSVPTLQHLEAISKAQSKYDEAVNYQNTVVSFAKRDPKTVPEVIVKDQNELAELLLLKGDAAKAEQVVRDNLTMVKNDPTMLAECEALLLKVQHMQHPSQSIDSTKLETQPAHEP